MSTRFTPWVVVLLWGAATTLSTLALQEIGPLAISFWRWFLALPLLWGAVLATGQFTAAIRFWRQHPWNMIVVGLSGMTLLYGLQNLALRFTTTFNASLLIELTPVFMAILGWLWLHERPQHRTWVGMLSGFVGAGFLTAGGGGQLQWNLIAVGGDALALGAALSGAVYTVYGKRLLQETTPLVMLTVGATVGTLFLLPLVVWEHDFWPGSAQTWGYLLALGVGASAFGNLWWFNMLRSTPAAKAGLYLFAASLIAAVLAVLIIGNPLTVWLVVGGILVVGGMRLVHGPEEEVSEQRSEIEGVPQF